MDNPLFKEGGQHNVHYEGKDTFSMEISIPFDDDGLVGRKCPNDNCSPAYFRIKLGTGILEEGYETAFCPYCRHKGIQSEFSTDEQVRFAKDTLGKETVKAVEEHLSNALGLNSQCKKKIDAGLISFEYSIKSSGNKSVRRPMDDPQRRDIVCPHCNLEHTVYGLAFWCPDCGQDIFLSHVEAEMNIITQILSDVDRRRELFGGRVAVKDLENCLEDVVSIFEAVLKLISQRMLACINASVDEKEKFFKRLRNKFQNPINADSIFAEKFDIELFKEVGKSAKSHLSEIFSKRHPITHNLGIVDRKYIERSSDTAKEGTEIMVDAAEIKEAIGIIKRVFQYVWNLVSEKSM